LRLTSPLNLPAPGRRQCVYGALCGLARTCVFAKQSLGPIHCDQNQLRCSLHQLWHPFFRSYGISMPSSLTTFHSFTRGYSPHPPVSVYGTDDLAAPHPAFLARRLNRNRVGRSLPSPSALRRVCTSPTALDGQSTRPLLRRFGVPGGSTLQDGAGMSTGCPSATPLGPRLRVRLTLR
jgi:hypothetical protein